ncbi:hypothetical protein ABZP36_028738 [Zizania latifolia]
MLPVGFERGEYSMQADQVVISLRPGGGGGGGPRPICLLPFTAATGSVDFLRPHGGVSSGLAAKLGDFRFEPLKQVHYTRDQLVELREVYDIWSLYLIVIHTQCGKRRRCLRRPTPIR